MIDWLTGTSRAAEADWPLPPGADWAGPKAAPFEVAADAGEPAAALAAPAAGTAGPLTGELPPAAGAPAANGELDDAALLEALPEHAVRVAEAMTRPVTAE
jgi:hypothetical protein